MGCSCSGISYGPYGSSEARQRQLPATGLATGRAVGRSSGALRTFGRGDTRCGVVSAQPWRRVPHWHSRREDRPPSRGWSGTRMADGHRSRRNTSSCSAGGTLALKPMRSFCSRSASASSGWPRQSMGLPRGSARSWPARRLGFSVVRHGFSDGSHRPDGRTEGCGQQRPDFPGQARCGASCPGGRK